MSTPAGQSRGMEFNPRPLSERELEQVQRLFSDPFAFPPEFLTWIRNSLEKDPPLFTSQAVQGAFEPLPGSVYDASVATGAAIGLEKLASTGKIGLSPKLEIHPSNGLIVNINRGTATLTSLRLNVNGTLYDVKCGAAGSGPGGVGRALWID